MPSDNRIKNAGSPSKGQSDKEDNRKKDGERIIVRVAELETKMMDLVLREELVRAKIGKLEAELKESSRAVESANTRIKDLTLQIYL